MTIQQLPEPIQARTGYTHRAKISYDQGDFTAAATTQSYTLHSIADGQAITAVARKNVTNLAITGASACVGILGDGSDDDGYCVSKSLLTGATPIEYQVGDGALLNQAGGVAYNAAGSLIYKLTSTDANIAAATAGEIDIYFRLVDLTKL